MAQRALIAMSGGVDSSAAACLMQERGYDCAGVMMRLHNADDGCGTLAGAADARAVAERLGMPFELLDCTDPFRREVIDRFAAAYQAGLTPNPCVECNRRMKFGHLLSHALERGMDCIATGHYARVEQDSGTGRFLLRRAADGDKDQSYVLYRMTQEQLARTVFPLGGLRKAEVRELAAAQGLVNAAKGESQDICFIPDGDYAAYLEVYLGKVFPKGRFVDMDGRDMGEHRGIIRYTVGQRRGLGLPLPERTYVCAIRPEDNTVVVGGREELYTTTLLAKNINLIALPRVEGSLRCGAKIRYRQAEQAVTVRQLDDDTLRLTFDTPQRAAARGQSVVLYDGDIVLGGGIIHAVPAPEEG